MKKSQNTLENFYLFKEKMISLYGADGKLWVNNLPSMVQKYAKDWHLSELQIVDELSMNYVLRGTRNCENIILKFGFENDSIAREARVLDHFGGCGCIRLLMNNANDGALLLQCANPGTSLKKLFPNQDKEASQIACILIKKLQNIPEPQKNSFPLLSNWLVALDTEWAIPFHHLDKARRLRDHLLATTNSKVLLHGDLHHGNILADGRDWVAIDPKGVIGDPVYEANCFIRNPLPEIIDCSNAKEIIKTRLQIFSQTLGFSQQRMLDWCYVQSVVSACWFIQNNSDPSVSIKLADIMELINAELTI